MYQPEVSKTLGETPTSVAVSSGSIAYHARLTISGLKQLHLHRSRSFISHFLCITTSGQGYKATPHGLNVIRFFAAFTCSTICGFNSAINSLLFAFCTSLLSSNLPVLFLRPTRQFNITPVRPVGDDFENINNIKQPNRPVFAKHLVVCN